MKYFCPDTQETAYNYKQYLKTTHWKNLRRELIDATGGICQLCKQSDKQLNLHHVNYYNIGHESRSDIQVICSDCHTKQHYDHQGEIKRPHTHASLGHSFCGILFPLCAWEVKDNPSLYLNCNFTLVRRFITCPVCKKRYDAHVRKALASERVPIRLHTTPTTDQDRKEIRERMKVKAQFRKLQAAEEFERKRQIIAHSKN